MKKIIVALICVMVLFCASFAVGCGGDETISSKGVEYVLAENGKEYVFKSIGTCDKLNIIIAEKYNGKPVTAIAENAFKDNAELKKVVIPKTVVKIGQDAFSGCSALICVYYGGKNATEWSNINILFGNEKVQSATRYYFRAEKPTVLGNFWCFNEKTPAIWNINPDVDPFYPDIYE